MAWRVCTSSGCIYFSLTQEEQIGELMAHSGDSSQHLSLMSEQLREKERLVSADHYLSRDLCVSGDRQREGKVDVHQR